MEAMGVSAEPDKHELQSDGSYRNIMQEKGF